MKNVRSIKQREDDRLAQVRAAGYLHRAAEVVGVDVESRTVELAFSSEAEVMRWGWIEVLSHDASAVRLARLNNGGALLDNHDWSAQRGVVEEAWLDSDRKCRARVRFSRSAAAEELFRDVQDGIKRHVSVGYIVHAIKLTEERDGVDVYTATDWEPYEISIVSVPADVTVGVGRAADPATKEEIPPEERTSRDADDTHVSAAREPRIELTEPTGESRNMDENEQQAAREAERRAGQEAERARVRAINELAAKYGNVVEGIDELTRTALSEGHSEAEFQRALLEGVNKRASKPLSEQLAGSDIGMSDREVRSYSFIRVVRALLDPTDKKAQRAAAFEFEASEAAREKQAKQSERFVIPTDVLRRAVMGESLVRAPLAVSAPSTGGNLVATELQPGSFVDVLRNSTTIMRRGRVLGGLVGNIDIPKKLTASQGYWVAAEDDDASETGVELGQLQLTPTTVAGYTEVTRKMLQQSSLDVEALLRADLATGLGLTIDLAGYYGSGEDGVPLGIANVSGINAVEFAGNNPTFAELVAMETAIASDNADVSGMSYVGNAAFRGYAKTTLKFAGVSGTIWEPGNTVNGYTTEITNQIRTGDVFLCNFGDLLIGLWGGLELSVDPYTHSKKGRIRIVAFQDVDFGHRRPESFCLGRKSEEPGGSGD